VRIRPEHTDDYDTIDALVQAAFDGRAQESMLVRALRQSPTFSRNLALIAEEHGTLVGHIMFSYVELHCHDGTIRPVLELAPLSVHPD
jgi:putative acetyltransferase